MPDGTYLMRWPAVTNIWRLNERWCERHYQQVLTAFPSRNPSRHIQPSMDKAIMRHPLFKAWRVKRYGEGGTDSRRYRWVNEFCKLSVARFNMPGCCLLGDDWINHRLKELGYVGK